MMTKRRVVITGIGVIAPNGIGKDAFWNALVHGRSGINKITFFDASSFPTRIAGEVNDFAPEEYMHTRTIKRSGRFAQLAMAGAKMAVEDASLKVDRIDPERMGVMLGTSSNAMDITENQIRILREKGLSRLTPTTISSINPHAATGEICAELGITGSLLTISTTCTGGLDAITYAFSEIKSGRIDVAIAGGVDAPLTELTFSGFCASRIMTTENSFPEKASRPFDAKRSGGVLSEGAGIIILESLEHASDRNGTIYGELIGCAGGGEGYNLFKTAPGAEGLQRVMASAIRHAEINPRDIDYICAHGPSDPLIDKVETDAVKKVFDRYAYNIPLSSIKSMIGNPLAAAGPMQLVASLMVLREGVVPPTINYDFPDPECDLDYVPNEARRNSVRIALINSHGFGGSNASLIIKRT